jgi:magnesium transporter
VEMEKSLIYFSDSIAPNNNVLEKILSGRIIKMYKNDEDILEDIIVDNRQTIQMTQVSIKNIRNMREAYTSILSNRLNKTVKLLTSITIILTIPTIISSIYGMNVELPLQALPGVFNIILIFILLVSLVLLLSFYKKGWL